MPIDVAMEEPGTGVVGNKSQGGRMHRQQLDRVTTHRVCLSLLQRWVEGGVIGGVVATTVDNLELMTVNMATW